MLNNNLVKKIIRNSLKKREQSPQAKYSKEYIYIYIFFLSYLK